MSRTGKAQSFPVKPVLQAQTSGATQDPPFKHGRWHIAKTELKNVFNNINISDLKN